MTSAASVKRYLDEALQRAISWPARHWLRPVRRLISNRRVRTRAREISAHFPPLADVAPVVFFRASTGVQNFSLNNAFHILAAWALRLQRVPVIHFACHAGMTRCVIGTDPNRPGTRPPCAACIRQNRAMLAGSSTRWFDFRPDEELRSQISSLTLTQLEAFEFSHDDDRFPSPIPLGKIVIAGLRWRLRRHHLTDDSATRFLFREYILSAWSVAGEFADLIEQASPQAVVVFNGQFFPEATARWVALQRGIRVITHEVGLQPFSAFFTDGEATAYPIHIPADFQLSPEQNAQLDAYLSNRFQGNFSMAGVRFWPKIKGLGEALLQRLNDFDQVVPVFTNVAFDTSQPHANTIFSDMFAWLECVRGLAGEFPRTFFIIRAHPDETRAGKASRETVEEWVRQSGTAELPNVLFVAPTEHLSSYELIQRSKFVMIYNSTIGLEATILGTPVLSAGKARFTQYPTVFFPATQDEYLRLAKSFLMAVDIKTPEDFRDNARRYLYYQLFKTSLSFEKYLRPGSHPGFVRFRAFQPADLLPGNSPSIRVILNGVLRGGDFLLE